MKTINPKPGWHGERKRHSDAKKYGKAKPYRVYGKMFTMKPEGREFILARKQNTSSKENAIKLAEDDANEWNKKVGSRYEPKIEVQVTRARRIYV